tara:strand:+ start:71 stop:295 length:225 start_codon:yes stop_codon:yes gene_type:complete
MPSFYLQSIDDQGRTTTSEFETEWLDTAVESVSDFLKGAGFEFDEITLIKNQSQKTSNKSIYNESVMVNTFNDD